MKRTSIMAILFAGLLLLIGTVCLSSASVLQERAERLESHLTWLAVALVAALMCAVLPLRRLLSWSPPATWRWLPAPDAWFWRPPAMLILFSLMLLVLLFIPGVGETRNGATRWLAWGGQPSELAKLALVIALADLAARRPEFVRQGWRGLVWPALLIGSTAGLIFLEPDWGSAMLLTVAAGLLLCLAGVEWFYLASAAAIGGLVFAHLALQDPLRLGRILSFLDPEVHRYGAGLQQWRSVLAIGSGGLCGRFFGNGHFKDARMPEQETDFVFSLIGEETGFLGCSLVVALCAGLVLCGLSIAWRAGDPLLQFLAAGITFLIGLQALINLGVVTSLLPNKGLPLPFVGYGGSNLICALAQIGLLVNIARRGSPPPGPLTAR